MICLTTGSDTFEALQKILLAQEDDLKWLVFSVIVFRRRCHDIFELRTRNDWKKRGFATRNVIWR